MAHNRLSKHVCCHDNSYHDHHCRMRHQGLCLSGDKGAWSNFGIICSAWWCLTWVFYPGSLERNAWLIVDMGEGRGLEGMATLVPAVCHPPWWCLQALWGQGPPLISLGSLVRSTVPLAQKDTICTEHLNIDYDKSHSTEYLCYHVGVIPVFQCGGII